MRKTIFALGAAATIAAATLSVPSPADAQHRGFWPGVGLGIVAGAIVGSAIANHPGYYTYDGYYADAPMDCPYGGYWARQAWRDDAGYVHYGRPRYFCR